ncbi:hypothetical protein SJAG_03766 [Schizosaccharomyces japonicus yFS275]|uniref:Uncharacterized protein n=1 Tax=Schizosaccharomyces japonicus (strain yFS275 / FY16936) TaxID=402676 RepID=B6K503_SCHJY|nr:hypothetical protein SJAG_03766 [Schizosaccharomyces japonicus yFS275]EEB08607.2 hypothetical protein SJAG_03766 [Schizosaccharomyces japonicus yFS275]
MPEPMEDVEGTIPPFDVEHEDSAPYKHRGHDVSWAVCPPKYDGRPDLPTLDNWFREVRRFVRARQIPPPEHAYSAYYFLTGDALARVHRDHQLCEDLENNKISLKEFRRKPKSGRSPPSPRPPKRTATSCSKAFRTPGTRVCLHLRVASKCLK